MAEYGNDGQELFDAITCPVDNSHEINPSTNRCITCGSEVIAVDEKEFNNG